MTFVRGLFLALAALFVQATLAPLFSIRDIQPDLVILLVVGIALVEGRFWGTIAGFALGLAVDATTTQFFGLSALTKAVAGYIAASFRLEPNELGFRRWLQVVAVAALTDRLLYHIVFGLGSGYGLLQDWLRLALPATIYTLLVAAIVAALAPRGLLRSRPAKF